MLEVSCEVTVFVFARLHQGTVKTSVFVKAQADRIYKKGRETKLSECEEISVKFLLRYLRKLLSRLV